MLMLCDNCGAEATFTSTTNVAHAPLPWMHLTPDPRWAHNLTFDAIVDGVLCFCGFDCGQDWLDRHTRPDADRIKLVRP